MATDPTKLEQEELGRLRQGIDALDDQMLGLINERARLAHRIGEIKHGNIYRPDKFVSE